MKLKTIYKEEPSTGGGWSWHPFALILSISYFQYWVEINNKRTGQNCSCFLKVMVQIIGEIRSSDIETGFIFC